MDETLTIHEGDPNYRKAALTEWGPFQLLEMVGHGGFGEVYRAFDTVLQREVALKLLLPRISSQADQEKEVLREARQMAKVRHPNVVSVYGVDTHAGRVGFWSDFVRGRTLASVLAMQGPFGPREAALAGIDICKAVSAVHGAGLLHRDIKTANVMREEGGRILLMDFGLSLEERDNHLFGGTPVYMAPELFDGGKASVASDIYAIGVLLYHLLTAKYPVEASSLKEMAAMHAANRRRSLYDERADLPEKLVAVIETATRTNPAERYQSVGQMLSALAESQGTVVAPAAAVSAAKPATGWFRWWMAIPLAAFVGAAFWFSPLRQKVPALRGAEASDGGAHAAYLQAQAALDKYYQPYNLENAINGFQKTVQMDPQFALAYGGLCRAYYISYKDLEAPDLLQKTQDSCAKALELDRDLASVHVTLGMLYTALTKNDLAAQELQTALNLDKRNAEAYAALADLYSRQGRTADVEPTYQKAEDLDTGNWRWPNQLAGYYLANGRYDDAVKQYQAALKLTPDNSRAWNNLGIAYRRQSKFEDAERSFRKAIEIDPADNYLSNLGFVLDQEGNYPGAADLYSQAVKLNPSNYRNWANLASVYDRIPGDKDKARDSYLKAVEVAEADRQKSPEDATLLANLGSYYATLDMPDKSVPLLRQAAALEPDNPQVLFRAGEGYELLHQREEALRWIGKALEKKYSLEALKRNPEMAALVADNRFAAIAVKYQQK